MRKKVFLEDKKALAELRAGDACLLSGVVYTARDAAHKKIKELLEQGGELPFSFADFNVYYAGPTTTPPGGIIGSCGPTTSARMDAFSPDFIARGQRVMIGKGERSAEVAKVCGEYGAVYFTATGGAGALLASRIVSNRTVLFPELGCEAIRRLEIRDFPAVVGIDPLGNSIFK